MIGKTISHYKILDRLGQGGMGVVYKALDVRLDRRVAVKFLSPALDADEEIKQRFIREAQAASALDHNNICTIYEIDEAEDGQMFIAMAFYEGGSLKDKIDRRGLALEDGIAVTVQIAQGLGKAHEQGIVHRDIKSANVVFTADGVAKIVDFGLAKLTGAIRLTTTGAMVGTPAYMSPEQIRQIDVDHRTDIWSLGVVLYEILTGRLPFRGDSAAAILYSILNEKPESLQKLAPDAPAEVAYVLDRALAKPVTDRYRSINEMLDDLRNLKGSRHADKSPTKETVTIPGKVAELRGQAITFSDEVLQPVQAKSLSFAEKLRFVTRLAISTDEPATGAASGNPYLNRLVIQHPDDFYGRQSEVTRIYERIKAVRPQSISIVGVRRIGKSSLLKALHHVANRRKHLPNPEEYVFVFVDLQAKRNVEPGELFRYIYGELQREYRGHLKLNVSTDYDGLQQIVQIYHDAGLKLVFLWDEFESVTRNPKIGPEFYAYFRSLANNYNVAYITSSSDQLQRLCHAKEISDSPFFNIFTNQRLGAFKPDEARELIVEPSAKIGEPLAPHLDFIIDLAGYFPFFVQIACSAMLSSMRSGKADMKKVSELFMEEAKPHFQEYIEKFDESQKAVVAALARGKKPPREHAFALKDLSQEGFIIEERLFSSLFVEFIRENVDKNAPWWKRW